MIFTPKEPRVARFTDDDVIVKDHHYYKNRDIGWNLPARIREKHYPYFHLQNDLNKPRLESMRQLEVEDKVLQEEYRKQFILNRKADTKRTFNKIVKENKIMEKASAQVFNKPNLMEFDFFDTHKEAVNIVAKRVNTSKHLRSKDNKWNFLEISDKKFVEQAIRPVSIKGEEENIKHVQKKIEAEKQAILEKKKQLQEFHDQRRVHLLQRHENNFEFEERCGLVSPSSMGNIPTAISNRSMKVTSIDAISPRSQTANGGFRSFTSSEMLGSDPAENTSFKLKFGKFLKATSTSRNQSYIKLAEPKEMKLPEFSLENVEMKGMLIKNMDDNLVVPGNSFYETLRTNSSMFQKALETSALSRKGSNKSTTSMIRPVTSSSAKIGARSSRITFNNIPTITKHGPSGENSDDEDEKHYVLSEIEIFEKKFCNGDKKVGYPKVALQEAYRLSSAQGLTGAAEHLKKKEIAEAQLIN